MLTNAYQQYQNNGIMTASPGELTLMLYNGAIKFINQGIEAIEKNDNQGAHNAIMKAQAIIQELRVTLDEGYDVSKQMDVLYVFVEDCLIEGNMTKEVKKLEDAREIVREFRDTWQQVLKTARR